MRVACKDPFIPKGIQECDAYHLIGVVVFNYPDNFNAASSGLNELRESNELTSSITDRAF